jgi:hypothetical protein
MPGRRAGWPRNLELRTSRWRAPPEPDGHVEFPPNSLRQSVPGSPTTAGFGLHYVITPDAVQGVAVTGGSIAIATGVLGLSAVLGKLCAMSISFAVVYSSGAASCLPVAPERQGSTISEHLG